MEGPLRHSPGGDKEDQLVTTDGRVSVHTAQSQRCRAQFIPVTTTAYVSLSF